MDQRQRRFHLRVLNVLEIMLHLWSHELPLVDEGLARQTADVIGLVEFCQTRGPDGLPGALADDIKFTLKVVLIFHDTRTADKQLLHERLDLPSHIAALGAVYRNIAPAETDQALLLDDLLENFHESRRASVFREEDEARTVLTRFWQIDANLAAFLFEKVMRNLDEESGSIARTRIGPTRSAMLEPVQEVEGFANSFVSFYTVHSGNKTNAAIVFLKCRVIKALLFWQLLYRHIWDKPSKTIEK